jgi:TRAP-type C4-dicarboxylate transport system permease small subunit
MRRLLVSVFSCLLLLFSFQAATVFADDTTTSPELKNGLCAGVNLDVNSNCNTGGLSQGQANQKLNNIIHTIINLLSVVVGVVAVIMIIIGGLRYITSGGSDTSVTGAKNTILYAIIGLIIVALAQVMVRFILSKVTQT